MCFAKYLKVQSFIEPTKNYPKIIIIKKKLSEH